MPDTAAAPDRQRSPVARLRALDGLRGIAMVLVVLSHAWTLVPHSEFDQGPTRGLFAAGNFAVTLFLVVGGYLLVRGLLREAEHNGRLEVGRGLLRRVLRVGLPVYVLLLAVLATASLQQTPDYPTRTTRASLGPIATFTWNWFLQRHGGLGRPDLGHLWYVSVYVQAMIVITVLCAVFVRQRLRLLAVLVLVVALLTWWKSDVAAHESLWVGLLRTTTRSDAMFWGALVAVAVSLLQPLRHRATEAAAWLFVSGMLALVALVVIPSDARTYLEWTGFVACLSAAAVVAGIELLPRGTALTRPLAWWPLERIGHWSLAIYIWHYPIFFFVTSHTTSWAWPVRTIVAVGVLALAVAGSRRYVETPVTGFVDRWAVTARGSDGTTGADGTDAARRSASDRAADSPAP